MKLFLTVGTQLPFDRLVRAVDQWAAGRKEIESLAQIGPAGYRPSHLKCVPFLDTAQFASRVEWADVVVAHAGMGSILMALERGKPIVVMPRRAELREHRNDHQLATARNLMERGQVAVALDEASLAATLDQARLLPERKAISPHASPRLIRVLRQFIETGSYAAHVPVEQEANELPVMNVIEGLDLGAGRFVNRP